MSFRLWLAAACAALALAVIPSSALAGYTDLNNFNLTETVSSYGAPDQFYISSGNVAADYRWLDAPSKATVISANRCTDLGFLGSSTFPVGDTNYRQIYYAGASGYCFVVRGRTTAGSGSMSLYDGRVNR